MSEYLYFGSGLGGDVVQLSPFFMTPITIRPADVNSFMENRCPGLSMFISTVPGNSVTFPTAEHLWQAHKAKDRSSFLRFTTQGDLGSWSLDVFAKTLAYHRNRATCASEAKKKLLLWQRKGCLGIQAKVATKPKYAKRLALDLDWSREFLAPDHEREIWLAILALKFAQNAEARRVLLATGSKILVEFDRSGARHSGKKVLSGDNRMGRYLEEIRGLY
jgi:predicted NAD-dependent protein-ADP-ribosyltransferase YbiA (DUF1768 family)